MLQVQRCTVLCVYIHIIYLYIPWAPKTVKNTGFGHLKTRLFTTKTSKNIGFGGPMVYIYIHIYISYMYLGFCQKHCDSRFHEG